MIYIAATIVLVALYFVGLFFFTKTLTGVLVVVGFFIALFLPILILMRKRESERRDETDHNQHMLISQCLLDLEEVEERVEASIEEFKGFGWHIKEFDKTGVAADIAEAREIGIDWRSSREYGEQIKYLIIAYRKLQSIRYDLTNIEGVP